MIDCLNYFVPSLLVSFPPLLQNTSLLFSCFFLVLFWFFSLSDSDFFSTLWSRDEICLLLCFCLRPIGFYSSFSLSVVIRLSFPLFSLFTPSYLHLFLYFFVSVLIFLLVFSLQMLFVLAVSVLSLALSVFLCSDEKITPVCPFVVFALRVFSSGSLPHAASLTARVKRTDPPRIANVLRGNRLNYAHCGGEDIHNTGIKLLKVTQYLALQLPAVYRRWRPVFAKLTCTCPTPPVLAKRLAEGTHHGCWPPALSGRKQDDGLLAGTKITKLHGHGHLKTLTRSDLHFNNIYYTWSFLDADSCFVSRMNQWNKSQYKERTEHEGRHPQVSEAPLWNQKYAALATAMLDVLLLLPLG